MFKVAFKFSMVFQLLTIFMEWLLRNSYPCLYFLVERLVHFTQHFYLYTTHSCTLFHSIFYGFSDLTKLIKYNYLIFLLELVVPTMSKKQTTLFLLLQSTDDYFFIYYKYSKWKTTWYSGNIFLFFSIMSIVRRSK